MVQQVYLLDYEVEKYHRLFRPSGDNLNPWGFREVRPRAYCWHPPPGQSHVDGANWSNDCMEMVFVKGRGDFRSG